MITVLTGCDKVGKSTLAKNMVKLGGEMSKYIHFSKPEGDALVYFSEAIRLADMGHNVVCDRWAEGDGIYAKALGHESWFRNRREYDDLIAAASMMGLTYIYCWDDVKSIARRFKKDGETFVPVDKIKKIQDAMLKEAQRMAELNKFPVYTVKFGNNNFILLNKIHVIKNR